MKNELSRLAEMDAVTKEKLGVAHTAEEIFRQPMLWEKTVAIIKQAAPELRRFLERTGISGGNRIILTGAGSSDYIGQTLQPFLTAGLGRWVDAVPTTEIVIAPESYLRRNEKLLLISFARSGNSPESLAALDIVDEFSPGCYHLIITCNKEGQLVRAAANRPKRAFAIVLDPEANDQGLAMTSSFTSMCVAGTALAYLKRISFYEELVKKTAAYAARIFYKYSSRLSYLTKQDYDRAVFLGDGPLRGIAAESHLKQQELTNGKVAAFYHSFLAFRHGPAAIIHPKTLVVYLLSSNSYRRAYELDLIKELTGRKLGLSHIILCDKEDKAFNELSEAVFPVLEATKEHLADVHLAPLYILFAQQLGLFRALELGVRPDAPNPEGTISRVVRGVTVYPRPGGAGGYG